MCSRGWVHSQEGRSGGKGSGTRVPVHREEVVVHGQLGAGRPLVAQPLPKSMGVSRPMPPVKPPGFYLCSKLADGGLLSNLIPRKSHSLETRQV